MKNKSLTFNELGPHFDMTLRRDNIASIEAFKTACKQPKMTAENKRLKKNLFTNEFGEQMGKVFVQRQDTSTLQLKKTKRVGGRSTKNKAREAAVAAVEATKIKSEDV